MGLSVGVSHHLSSPTLSESVMGGGVHTNPVPLGEVRPDQEAHLPGSLSREDGHPSPAPLKGISLRPPMMPNRTGVRPYIHINLKKVKGSRPICVFGRDVTMESVEALSKRALVGRFEFISLSRTEILDWIQVV